MVRNSNIACAAIIGICIAVGLVSSSFFIFKGITKFRSTGRFVTVKGLAEREVKADSAVWKIKFKVSGNDFAKSNDELLRTQAQVEQFLFKGGLTKEEVGAPAVRLIDLYAREFGTEKIPPNRYILESKIMVSSTNVDLVEKISAKASELVKAGVLLDEAEFEPNPKYYFSGLNKIRPEMLAEATKSARILAEQFAKDSASHVGSIRQANQGVFSISSKDSQENTANNELTTIIKKVRVVSTIDYFLTDG